MNEKDFLVITHRFPGTATVARMARTHVAEGLAVCVNIVPVICSTDETAERVAVPVADGHDAYLSWVAQATRASDA